MSPTAVVLGGGFAGLSAAVALADKGFSVQLLEKKRLLGGRAFSYTDPETDVILDNGQHLLMGCYHHTLELLSQLNTSKHLLRQKALHVDFLDDSGQIHSLKCPQKGGIFGLLWALARLSSIPLRDKLKTFFFFPTTMKHFNENRATVSEWLKMLKQPESMIQNFWAPLCFAALNDSPEKSSASLLIKVLEEAFSSQPPTHGLIFPKAGLSELTGEAAKTYLESRQSQIKLNTTVKRLHLAQGQIVEVECLNGERIKPDVVISTLPPTALKKILDSSEKEFSFPQLNKLRSSPILSIHLWVKPSLTDRPFLALLDSPFHWVFNREKIWGIPKKETQLLSLVVSGAHDWMDRSNQEIQSCVEKELARFFPQFHSHHIQRIKIIKEPEATLSPAPNLLPYRLKQKTALRNFFLAGDWTQTGLPATIESAVLSGKLAAEEALKANTTQEVTA